METENPQFAENSKDHKRSLSLSHTEPHSLWIQQGDLGVVCWQKERIK